MNPIDALIVRLGNTITALEQAYNKQVTQIHELITANEKLAEERDQLILEADSLAQSRDYYSVELEAARAYANGHSAG